jgi:hypothetical protein
MPLSEDELTISLSAFVEKWRNYAGSERAEAQTFVNQLLACYTPSSTKQWRPLTDGRRKAAHDSAESNRLLLELNQAIAVGRVDYSPF